MTKLYLIGREVIDMADILQYSADIVDNGNLNEKEFIRALENAGFTVLGAEWKAAWTEDDYEHGRPPYSWD